MITHYHCILLLSLFSKRILSFTKYCDSIHLSQGSFKQQCVYSNVLAFYCIVYCNCLRVY